MDSTWERRESSGRVEWHFYEEYESGIVEWGWGRDGEEEEEAAEGAVDDAWICEGSVDEK